MSTLARYDVNTYKADMKQIPLIEGAKKYSDWQEHQDGADVFARLTLMTAMREFLIVEKDVTAETLTSPEAVYEKYMTVGDLDEWDREQRDLYILRLLKRSAFRYTIGGKLREFAVRHHASGLTTAEVISLILDAPEGEGLTPLRDYTRYFPSMKQAIRDYLSTQLNYLKRGQPRFPQKYNALWQEARAEHLREIQHIPLTHVTEQVQAMQQHYQKLLDAFNALPDSPEYTRERERLTNAMNKTMSGIYQMTRDPAYPKPQTLEHTPTRNPIETEASSVGRKSRI